MEPTSQNGICGKRSRWNGWSVFLGLFVCALQIDGLGIPMLYTQGTHFQIGKDIGQTFQRQVHEYFDLHPLLHPVLLPWYHTPKGKQIYENFLEVAQGSYPQYVEEMKGMAEGANVSFVEVFLMNYRVEISTLLGGDQPVVPDACSDIFVNYPQNIILGHNEDNVPILKDRGYLVQANIPSEQLDGGIIAKEEHFTVYCYPGELPGNAFGFNSAGLVLTMNALYPKLVGLKKTGRQILTRALLAATSKEDVLRILNDVGHGAAYGFSVNMGILPTTNGSTVPSLWNVEVAPSGDKSKSFLDAHEVVLHAKTGGTGDYFHVNMYRRLNVDQVPEKIVSSKHRTARIQNYPLPVNEKDVLAILGDTQDSQYPIYRTPSKTDNASTVATAVFDLKQCTMSVYKDNPKLSSGPVHVFHLPCDPST